MKNSFYIQFNKIGKYSLLGILGQLVFVGLSLGNNEDPLEVKSIYDVAIETVYNNTSLANVFEDIESKTDFVFTYDKKDSFLKEDYSKPAGISTVGNILQEISQTSKLIFQQTNYNISIRRQNGIEKSKIAAVVIESEVNITGKVTSGADGEGLPGVNILVAGTGIGTVTDIEGNYSLDVPQENDVLVFSSIGYITQQVPVDGRNLINVVLQEDLQHLDEVVIVGYTTQRRKDVTSAVASVDVESLQKRAVTDVTQAMQGNVAGVNIIAGNGNPGSPININIRGVSSFSGDNTPLVLVDGVQVEGGLREINPNDILSIEVLKDASSAAIYGSRAANGVILVSTKKGDRGGTQVNYQNYVGVQVPYAGIDVANSREYITILQRMYGEDLSGEDLIPQAAKDYLANPGNFQDYDWQKEIYRSAPMQSHDLAVAGGGEFGTFRISAGYVNQDGITLGTGYERVNIRANSVFDVSDKFTIGQSISLAKSSTETEPYAFSRSTYYQAIAMYPYFAPKLPNGDWQTSSFYYGGGDNPEALIRNPFHYQSIWNGDEDDSDISLNMYGELSILENLTYNLSGSYSQGTNRFRNYFGDKGEFQDEYFDDNLSLFESEANTYNYSIDNTLRYQKQWEKHRLDVTVGFISQKFGSRYMEGSRQGFLSDITSTLDGPGGKNPNVNGGKQESSLLSGIAQAFYSYSDRYLITVNFRRDGSSRFGPDYRWGNFPGFSMGWRLSGEEFWKNSNLDNKITELKIRAGYGVLGRQNLGNYDYLPVLQYIPVAFGSSIHDGLITGTPINEAISWERLISKTIGIDYELFDGKVSGSFDYYNNDTKDMIIGVAIAPSVGGGELQSNVGEINNKGFEMSLSHANTIGEFNYNLGFNLSTVKTTLINIGRELIEGDGPEWDVPHSIEIRRGGGLAEFWLIESDGLFKSQEEINNHTNSEGVLIQPNAQPGDIRFVDANDDGVIDSEGDRQFQGSGIPKVNMGFNFYANYKGFDLYLGLTGAFGQVIYNGSKYLVEQNYGFDNFGSSLLEAYDPVANPGSDFPRLNPNDVDDNWNSRPTSDRYIENGSYVKIRNVEVGYSLPVNSIPKLKMSSARVFARVQNLLNITGYSGADPEVGSSPIVNSDPIFTAGLDRDTAPQARSFQLGVNVTFQK